MNNTNNKKELLGYNQQERLNVLVKSTNYRFWLGGFVEGEGSLTISITLNNRVRHGIVLQPEFNVTQHESGIDILNSFKVLFEGLGSVHNKSGSDKVLVYSIKGTSNIVKHVIPFYKNYVIEYSSKYKTDLFKNFDYVLNTLHKSLHYNIEKDKLIELVKLIYTMNPDGKGKQRKRTLDEIMSIINNKS